MRLLPHSRQIPSRMKKLLCLFALITSCLHAQQTLDLGPRGQVTLFVLGDWKFEKAKKDEATILTISPTKYSINASATLVVMPPENDGYDAKPRLKMRVEAECMGWAEQSVEGKAVAREFTLTTGYGYYCSFTDPELRGKPPEKGNYKVMSVGKIRLAPDVLMNVVIHADGFRDEPYQQLLAAIEGLEFTPGRER